MMATAEGGSAWTLLYPKFHAVVIKPETRKIPLAYPIAEGDRVLANIINKWIYLQKDSPSLPAFELPGLPASELPSLQALRS